MPAVENVAVVDDAFALANVMEPEPLVLTHVIVAVLPVGTPVTEPARLAVDGSVMIWFDPRSPPAVEEPDYGDRDSGGAGECAVSGGKLEYIGAGGRKWRSWL